MAVPNSNSMTSPVDKAATVAVIGAGWLGRPLASALAQAGYNVIATSRTEQKCEQLRQSITSPTARTNAVQVSVVDAPHLLNDVLLTASHWVICIPPGIRHGRTNYPAQIEALMQLAQTDRCALQQIVLISSTAVYNGLSGVVDEHAELDMSDDKVALLASAEKSVLKAHVAQKTVLRLAGLFGYERQPARFFSNKSTVDNPDSVVNMIHRDDAIGLIVALLAMDSAPEVVNGVCPHHPTRKAFYQTAFASVGRNPVAFAPWQGPLTKCVASRYFNEHNFKFNVNDLLNYFSQQKILETDHA
ncbi:NAD(P)-binding domain-containing protein [Thalassotalea ponticola]|uniref:NAD(P)-binding domain-containing protein n=1 Tax=Thalassotalea ponticola TaxID=1523392 RepID=UPI0025B3DA0E|nr:NAD(P)-binding domain-containing protein [Thalassotalea ponticola]MDN3653726.1 NAD(P)-binding domain-containing protein [Thalassotalea ponticola]